MSLTCLTSLTKSLTANRNSKTVKAAFAAAVVRWIARLPLPLIHGLGVVCGCLLWLIGNDQRRIATINIDLCFPERSSAERRRLLRRSLIENSKAILEMGRLWLCSDAQFRRWVSSDDSEQQWRAATQHQGALIVTPHLGAWEVAGLHISRINRMTAMYRPSRLGTQLDTLMRAGRERFGATLVPTDNRGIKLLLQALRRGDVVGILPDQNPGPDSGLYAPFFGQPAYTMVLVSKLAQRCKVPVFIVYAERLSWGRGYRVRFRQLPASIASESLQQSVEVLNQAVERAVSKLPEQYLWSYKRFKKQPADRPKLYQRRSSELLNKRA